MVGEALRLIRVFHDMTAVELSSELGVSKSLISEIENGRKKPTLGLVRRYSEYFEIPVSSIMFFSEELGERETEFLKNGRKAIADKILAFLALTEKRTDDDQPNLQ
ncbi:MAG TPA: helix-turn-helix transcriptional regulator [Devosiaceae bacterium]